MIEFIYVNDKLDTAWGLIESFESMDSFIDSVIDNIEKLDIDSKYQLLNERKVKAIFSKDFIPACTLIPLDDIKFEIRSYYVVDIFWEY